MMRSSKYGTMPPQWWVMNFSLGYFSITPLKTSRVMAAVVSYGQPNMLKIQYLEWSSLL